MYTGDQYTVAEVRVYHSHNGWTAVVDVEDGSFLTDYRDTEQAAREAAETWLAAWQEYCRVGR